MNGIVLRSLDDVGKIAQRLREAFDAQGRKPLELTLKRYKPKRSLDQNARLWALHTLTAQRLNEVLMDAFADQQDAVIALALRNPWTPEKVHKDIYKPQFLNGKSSTRRDKMQTCDDQEDYVRWMAEIGVDFQQP